MFKLLSRRAQQVADYFTACHLCDIGVRAHHGVCQSCWQQLPWLKHKIERHQQDILIACHYEYPISQLIQQFKYEQQLHHLRLLSELYVVKDMHERKTKMAELADGFIALPGGAGTLEEIFEQWTWNQLGIHQKPCAFLNINGFYDDLIKMLQTSVEHGFSQARFVDTLIVSDNIHDILAAFQKYQPAVPKWTSRNEIQA